MSRFMSFVSVPSAPAASVAEERPADALGKHVVEIEVELRDPAHAPAAAIVDRDLGLERELRVTARPDEPWIDRARRAAGAAIQARRKRDLHDRDHAVEGLLEAHVLHERLQIDEAVLEREAPLQEVGMPLDV